jgi:hypothetical protein
MLSTGNALLLPINRSIVQGLGVEPVSFLSFMADLIPKFIFTVYIKFVDDLTVVVYDDSAAQEEVVYVIKWDEHCQQ